MELLITILFIVVIFVILFLIEYWWVLLIIVGVVGSVVLILWLAYLNSLNKIVFANIIKKTPIIGTVSEKTGHTTSYGRHLSYHEHYRDRNVITGYNVTFLVEYESGKKSQITCQEGSVIYNKLIKK